MYCTKCGAAMREGMAFCAQCGVGAGAGAPAAGPGQPAAAAAQTGPVPGRVDRLSEHLHIVAILWVATGVLRLMMGWGGWAFMEGMREFFDDLPFHGWRFIGSGFLGFGVLRGVAALAAGWGLYNREPWARTLALILAFFSLGSVPLGTILGIYTLWVLLPAESKMRYGQMAQAPRY